MPSDGILASLPKTTVKTTIVSSGRSSAHSDANDRLFVAHQDVAPGQEEKQFAIAPQVGPVGAFGFPGFDDKAAHDLVELPSCYRDWDFHQG